MFLGILLVICEFTGLFRLIMLIFNYINFRESPKMMDIYHSEATIESILSEKGAENVDLPDVDIFVTACREPAKILEKTIHACTRLHYPEKEKVHVYLLDDGDSPELERLAAEYGIEYITREVHNAAKAGNLNHALRITHSELVVVFDADMVPRADFLSRTVIHFLSEKNGRWSGKYTNLGFLQTPQAFYTEDLYQSTFRVGKIVPNEQDQFYRNLQPCKSSKNAVICCGSNAVMLRRALEEVGYFTEETITEDFATGLKIQKAGYSSLAIDRTLAEGTTPDSLRALIRQRERWGRGTIQTLKQCGLWSRDFSWGQRLNLMASLTCWFYPFERLYLFLAPMFYPLFRLLVVEAGSLSALLHWLPILILSQVGMILASGRSKNLSSVRWAAIYEFSLSPFLLIPILKEVRGIRKSTFEVTGAKSRKKDWNWYYTLPFLLMLALTLVSLSRTLEIIYHSRSLGYLLLLIWHVINLYFSLIMMIFVFRVRKPKEHIVGHDKLAHNLNNYYLPVYDLIRLIFDPLIRRKKGYEDRPVTDYAVLHDHANKKTRRIWLAKRFGKMIAEFGILALMLVFFGLFIIGRSPVILTDPVFENLAWRARAYGSHRGRRDYALRARSYHDERLGRQ